MSDGAARENCSVAERQFGNAQTEGSFGAGMVKIKISSSRSRRGSVNNRKRLLSEVLTVNKGGNAVIRPLHDCRGRF